MASVRVEEDRQTGVTIVGPIGRLDSGQVEELEHVLRARMAEGRIHLVVDFGATLFIASSALRVVLVAHKKVEELEGRLLLCNMAAPISDVFKVSGFRKFLNIEEDRATAVRRAMPEGFVPEVLPAPGRGFASEAPQAAPQAVSGRSSFTPSIIGGSASPASGAGLFRRILSVVFSYFRR